jgi:hypothetical protein
LISVETLDDGLVDAYEAFVRGESSSLFYHGTAFRRLLRELLGAQERTLVALEDGDARGVLPLLSLDGPSGRVYNSLPYYGSHGGVIATSPAAGRALVDAYRELATAEETLAATIVPNPFGGPQPDGLVHNLTDERIVQFTQIPATAEALARSIDSSARRNVEKARRLGYEIARDASALPRLYELHEANIRAIGGRPKQRRFFELVADRMRAGEQYDVWVAREGSSIAAALLVFYWGRVVEYYTPAIDVDQRSNQPLSLILFEAILDAGQRGFEIWNWGGTWLTQQTLYRFKRKWGAEERSYSYLVQLNDEAILGRPRSAILDAYPDFYVVPFDALTETPSPGS